MSALLVLLVGIGYTGTRYHIATLRSEMQLQIATRAMVIEMLDRGKSDEEIWARIEAMDAELHQKGRTVEEIGRIIEAMRREHGQ